MFLRSKQRRASPQFCVDKVTDRRRVFADNGEVFAKVDIFNGGINDNGFRKQAAQENRPVVISNTKQAETAISRSTASKAVPIFIEVYFFRIMATMSVPPLEAPMLNMIAGADARNGNGKISSRTGWSVSGPDMETAFSAADSATDIRTLIYTVFTPKPFPETEIPAPAVPYVDDKIVRSRRQR